MPLLLECRSLAGRVLALALLFAGAQPADAAGPRQRVERLPLATSINVGPVTLTPYGWAEFCSRNEVECPHQVLSAQDTELSRDNWATLRRINIVVNTMIHPISDQDHWGMIDRWDLPTDGFGDCEDYVLLKRKLLIAEGLPRQSLLVTIVKDERGEGHAVLTVKTDRGDFILDNMNDEVKPWHDVPYVFVKRQSQSDANLWEQIGEPTSAPLIVSRE
jgi:predicted transglutaminase-like cysteine proteinase